MMPAMKNALIALSLLSQPMLYALPSAEAVEAVQNCPCAQLLEKFGISPYASKAEIVLEAQRLWLQRDRERWEFDQRFEPMKAELMPLFDRMGMLQKAEPKRSSYDYVLVVGALAQTVESRVGYLADLIAQGMEVREIVFLTGERPLLPSEREKTGAETERQMAEWVYSRSELPRSIPVRFIDAPMNGTKRPGLADTITLWLEGNPKAGSFLLLSSQPYLGYHQAIASYFLNEGFEGDAAGPAVKGSPSAALLLDTYARELFWRNSK